MEQFSFVDIFSTKGIEYLIVIGFLILVIPFWRLLNMRRGRGKSQGGQTARTKGIADHD